MINAQPAPPFAWTPQPWGRGLLSAHLAAVARHCFTTSDLALRGEHEEQGWTRLAASIGVDPGQLVRLKQVHGAAVVVIRQESANNDARPAGAVLQPAVRTGVARGSHGVADEARPHADVVMTDAPATAVAVQVADCVPLLLADPVSGAVAAVHAGWRGTASRVVQVAVDAMHAHFGTRPADVLAAVGPSIGACCYQVREDVVEAFRSAGFGNDDLARWFHLEDAAQGRYRLDVATANRDQLVACGVEEKNVGACGLCTACHPSLFPSYRRDGAGTGRIAGIIRPDDAKRRPAAPLGRARETRA